MSAAQYTADDVARWMLQEISGGKPLYQDRVTSDIPKRFGNQFLYYNANGNPAIRKDVLAAFRKLTDQDVVWSRGERCWRKREANDKPGRQQD